ncbi:60S ribosomal protein L29-like [Arvicola amphibius]|uniref:60S ribosomal protein L29-like n=1 Tax=Arvicola amphibius TaxID=1047088 RepID=UPI001C09D926|nr:60S ribosomal protein L29-like [Arvicola amphibius]
MSLKSKDLKFWGNMQFAKRHKSELMKMQASNAKVKSTKDIKHSPHQTQVEPKIQEGGDHMPHHLTYSKPMNQVHAHMATDQYAVQRQRPRRTFLGQTKMPSEAPKGVQASRKVTEKARHVNECNNLTPLSPAAF